MKPDIAHLKSWIGRTAEEQDLVTPRLVAEYRSIFGPHLAPAGPDEAPLGFHWLLSPAIVPLSETGPDGHPARGGFLPPVPLPRRMWAGGEVEVRALFRVGDTVTRRSTVEDVSLKEGRSGPLCFVAVRHEYETVSGLAVSERHDIVYRDPEAGGPAKPAGAAAPAKAPQRPDLTWMVETPPPLLFRYSAVTFNGHRIHYDLPYATSQEGYAGLVVHGPIQATLLLNAAAVVAGGLPERFRYRGVSPMIAGTRMTVKAARGDDGTVACRTVTEDGRVCMEGRAAGA